MKCGRESSRLVTITVDYTRIGVTAQVGNQFGELLEEQLGQHLIRTYALPTDTAHIDTTTVSVYHQGDAGLLLDYGQSKDHRPDLRQFKQVLSTLDPLGVPLCSATVAGRCAAEPTALVDGWCALAAVSRRRLG